MTREEAIRRIKAWNLDSDDREVLAVIIPELAESEDERIRKGLVKLLTVASEAYVVNSTGIKKDSYLTYLEKQKEQKPAENISQLTVQGKGVYKICPRCKERMVRDDSMVYTSMPPQYRYECPKCGESECDTVMYDNPEMEEQKPIVTHGETYHVDTLGTQQVIAGKMPQKPAEWNEEDERMLKWIEDILLIADDDLSDKLNGRVSPITDSAYSSMKLCIAKCLSWLKSFRPSWKPSEEQMKALSDACCIAFEEERDFHPSLSRLHHDLRKL